MLGIERTRLLLPLNLPLFIDCGNENPIINHKNNKDIIPVPGRCWRSVRILFVGMHKLTIMNPCFPKCFPTYAIEAEK